MKEITTDEVQDIATNVVRALFAKTFLQQVLEPVVAAVGGATPVSASFLAERRDGELDFTFLSINFGEAGILGFAYDDLTGEVNADHLSDEAFDAQTRTLLDIVNPFLDEWSGEVASLAFPAQREVPVAEIQAASLFVAPRIYIEEAS